MDQLRRKNTLHDSYNIHKSIQALLILDFNNGSPIQSCHVISVSSIPFPNTEKYPIPARK